MKQIPIDSETVRLVPDEWKILFSKLDKQPHSEAIVNKEKTKYFEEK